ncbi:MAG: hypothetical protein VX777_09050 [Chlamydiota bacterium]|nr:hypothetical protein [Chlamydiota bacterium]
MINNDDDLSLRDAAVTIPKTVTHVVVDAGVVVGVVLGGTVAALGATVVVAGYTFMWGFTSAKDAAVSGFYKTAERIAKVYNS